MTQETNPEIRWGIQDLFSRYCWSLDTGDTDMWVDTFTPDGVFESPTSGIFEGHEALDAFHKEVWTRPETLNALGRQHRVNNLLVSVEGKAATARSQFMVILPGESGARIGPTGEYHDELLLGEDGKWRFRHRIVASEPTRS